MQRVGQHRIASFPRATAVAIGVAVAFAVFAGTARAADKSADKAVKVACNAAHEQAQLRRQEKKLRAAREQFIACAREGCPAVLRRECSQQLAEVETNQPSIVLDAKDGDGKETSAVRVQIDGEPLVSQLSGGAIAVDPGEHAFRFESAAGEVIQQRVIVLEGDKNRKVSVDFASLKPPPKPPPDESPIAPTPGPRKGIPPAAFVLGGVAVVGLGSFAFFALTGKNLEKSLASSCAPRCAPDVVSPVHRDYVIADISLAVAIVSAGAAVWLALPSKSAPSGTSRAGRSTASGVRVGVLPFIGGAGVAAAGSF